MIVVDASAAVAALLHDGPARATVATEAVHAPHLVDVEVASALRRTTQAGLVKPRDAWAALDTWRRMGVVRYPAPGLYPRVWELRENLSAYDATYVALAEELGCGLLTADRRLASAPGIRCPIVTVHA